MMKTRLVNFLKKNKLINYFLNRFTLKFNYEVALRKLEDITRNNEKFIKQGRIYESGLQKALCENPLVSKKQACAAAKEIVQTFYFEMTGTSETITAILKKNNIQDIVTPKELEIAYKIFYNNSILYGHYIPLFSFLYIKIYNFIWEEKIKLEKAPVESRMTVGEIYDILKKIPEKVALTLLKNLHCSTYIFDCLIDNFKQDRRTKFIDTVHSSHINISLISATCYQYQLFPDLLYIMVLVTNDLYQNKFDLKHSKTLDRITSCMEILHNLGAIDSNLENNIEKTKDVINIYEDDDPEVIYQSIELSCEANMNILKEAYKICITYMELDEFTPKEKVILNRILKNPRYLDFYNELLDELKHEKTLIDSELVLQMASEGSNGEAFTLPGDYFESESNMNDRLCTADVKTVIKQQGVDVFKEFINYIANEGYIENNAQTKRSFAYRLTGRCRPDDLVERIEWKTDKDPKSYCLYCIVRYFYSKSNGRMGKQKGSNMVTSKYKRMLLFFICIEQDYSSDYCKYADDSEIKEFISYMKSLFTDQIMKDE